MSGEIQPVVEPVDSEPPKSNVDTKVKTEKKSKSNAKPEEDAKVKRDKKSKSEAKPKEDTLVQKEKKCKSDLKASIGNPWNTGLFNCHEDRTNAIVTAFLPCITFGQIAEVLDEGKLASPWGTFFYFLLMPVVCSQCIMGSKYRKKLRKKYDMVEAPYTDKVSHFFCPCCSLCQEYRELKIRGVDPSLGWKGILAQRKQQQNQNQQPQVPPEDQVMVK